jgi:hypothetical protein
MMWLNISFSPYQHYAVGAALSRKRKAACGPNSMTSRRSAEVQNLFHSIAECGGQGVPAKARERSALGFLAIVGNAALRALLRGSHKTALR